MLLYEDKNLLVISKPAGLVVHSDGRTVEATLADWVKGKYPELKDIGGLHTLDSGRYSERWGIVHRLDRDTSGVLLVAKDAQTFLDLQRQFLERKIEKTYHAVVRGTMEDDEGTIDMPIGRNRADFRQWAVAPHARGTLRSAITDYKVLGEYDNCSFLELSPKTGRTHQLRVHLSALRHPIVGDTRYGTTNVPVCGFKRLALHARKIVFLYEGKKMEIVAPYPDDFEKAATLFGV